MNMRRVAIIPARGGSKRLPRKNVVQFLGKPIMSYTIMAALETGLFERVIVSTDDAEIATIAHEHGVETLNRPYALATDVAQVKQVCGQVLDSEERAGRSYDVFCCLYATAPLRNALDISSVVELIEPGKCDFAMAVTGYEHAPYQALVVGNDGTLSPKWPELVNLRSQEIGEMYVDNGSTYAVSVTEFRRHDTFYGPGLKGHIMPRERSVDIDVPIDLDIARCLAESLY